MAGKLSKEEALYFGPASIGSPIGASCDKCYKFVAGGSCIEVRGPISGPRGICGLYVHGDPRAVDPGMRLTQVSKAEAGYAETAPTHCKTCSYFKGRTQAAGLCEKVEGVVQANGCCNLYEPAGS